jgi:hypothetical protein
MLNTCLYLVPWLLCGSVPSLYHFILSSPWIFNKSQITHQRIVLYFFFTFLFFNPIRLEFVRLWVSFVDGIFVCKRMANERRRKLLLTNMPLTKLIHKRTNSRSRGLKNKKVKIYSAFRWCVICDLLYHIPSWFGQERLISIETNSFRRTSHDFQN